MLDALTYAGRRRIARRGAMERITFVEGDVADADARRPARRGRRRRRALRGRVAQRQLARRPAARSCAPTWSAPSRCSRRSAGTTCATTTSRPTRSTATSSSTTRSKFTEDTPYNPSSPYSSTKAGSDLLVRAWVRSFGVRATISNCSNNYGPYQHVEKFIPRQITNVHRRRPAQALRRRAQRARLDPRRRPQRGRLDDHRQGRHRRDLPHRRRRRGQQPDVVRAHPRAHGPGARRLRPRHRPRRATTCATPSTPASCAPSSAGRRATTSFRDGLAATIDWYRDNEAWWRPMKDATEAKYARTQQVVTR